MIVVFVIAGVCLVAAAFFATFRLIAGPDSLDRLVSMDTLIGVSISGIALWAAFSGNTTVAPAIVALALISFVGSVAIARFRVQDK
ncbi:cation:proton antiporter [Rhodococcus rhodnii]|uniref:Cation:proton antiporter n=2 Tax=Rhodococcus rhodnii TaxID=38312 RepID=A0A6P2CJK8_9NOCA|nr:monovalent cation/H+ antiporter complex subunit F [Rhodococcus rhodnii]EOM77966.1 putative multisubunit sodium/proton antiporter [Rhodococcus rhodnii LMG 5362]TXG92040.1 cation:proton antiporter [Rhodococcus rhodnii]